MFISLHVYEDNIYISTDVAGLLKLLCLRKGCLNECLGTSLHELTYLDNTAERLRNIEAMSCLHSVMLMQKTYFSYLLSFQ